MNNDLKDLLLTFLKQKYQEEPFSLILHTDTSEFPIPLIMTAEAIKCRLLDRYMMEEIPFRQFMALNTRIVLDFLKEPKYENIINEIYQKRHGEHLKYEDMLDSVEQYIGDLFDAIRRSSSRGKLLNKLLDLLRVHSAIMATQQIGIITDKFRNDQNDNSIWKNMYYLGQYISNALHTGVLAHLYHSKIASEIKTQSLMHLDELKAEARTLAEEYLIDGEYETFDELAGDIFEDQKKSIQNSEVI